MTQSAERTRHLVLLRILMDVEWAATKTTVSPSAAVTGGKDVFVHAKTLERGGLSDLAEGQRVRMQIGQGQKGPEARSVELLD